MRIPPMPPRGDRPAGQQGFVSLRDTFAAAALTGLLSNVQRYQNGPLTEQAFEIADFMLKEREKTSVGVAEMDSASDRKSVATPRACARSCSQPFDSAPITHNASPEARVQSPSPDHSGHRAATTGEPGGGVGTGNTQEPAAWAVIRWWDNACVASFNHKDEADDRRALEIVETCHRHDVVPLYRALTLTDDEREAVEEARTVLMTEGASWGESREKHADTLRSLLQRLGGTNG
jgi:hypothetical protein